MDPFLLQMFELSLTDFYYCRYASEVDVDFVRKSVRAIGRCAIKIEEASERCINVLLDLINTGINYVVQEAIVVIKVYSSMLNSVGTECGILTVLRIGHFPKIPSQVRRHYSYAMRKLRCPR
jgi:vesicle coat complex subunit